MSRRRTALYRTGFLVVLLALWTWAAHAVSYPPIATPWETATAAWRLLTDGPIAREDPLLTAIGDTLGVFLRGYLLAIVVGVPFGVLMGMLRPFGKTLDIYVYALAATPRIAFIPLIIAFLGLGGEAKAFIVFLGALMPILINTYAGVLSADEELVEMARSAGAGRARIFGRILLPGAVPFIVAGLRIGATIGLINTVVAELYLAASGLGALLNYYGRFLMMAEYFTVVLCLAFIGVAVTELLRAVESRLTRWRGNG